jgi:hypothetical protein
MLSTFSTRAIAILILRSCLIIPISVLYMRLVLVFAFHLQTVFISPLDSKFVLFKQLWLWSLVTNPTEN